MKSARARRHSIGRTFIIGIVGVLILGMGTSMYLIYRVQRSFWLEKVKRETEKTSEIVKQSLDSAMIAHQPERIQETLSKISRIEGIKAIMFIDKEGRVKWSGDPARVGEKMDRRDPSCQVCHARPVSKRPRAVELRIQGDHIFRTMNPLYNKKVCRQCHSSGNRTIGVLLLDVSMEDTDRIIAAVAKKLFQVSMIIIIVISVMIFLFTRRFVQKPVMKLVDGARRIGEGNLNMTIEAVGDNEFGELAEAFNSMAENLADYVVQVEEKTRLESYSRMLEDRVAERTDEIEETNRKLQQVNRELTESYGKLEAGHRQLKETQAQLFLSGKLAALGELAGGVAHELNNPLAGIMTFMEALSTKAEAAGSETAFSADCLKIFPHIERELHRCKSIIEDLLAFARVKAPGVVDMDLNGVIREVIAVLEGQPGFRSIELKTELAGDLSRIRSDRNHMSQIVMNVIVNATQSISGRGTLTVMTRNVDGGESILFSVSDTGCGISNDVLPKIFDPFFTTKEEGTGLGLSVTHGIVKKLGGEIDVETEVGRGTTISFILPVRQHEYHQKTSEKILPGSAL